MDSEPQLNDTPPIDDNLSQDRSGNLSDSLNEDALSIFLSESHSAVKVAERAEGLVIRLKSEITHELAVIASQSGHASGPELTDLCAQIQKIEIAVRQSMDDAGALKRDMDQLRESAAQLAGEHRNLAAISREADQRSGMALNTVKDMERRLASLAAIDQVGDYTDQRLSALSVLADDVMRKAEALEGQKGAIERAAVEATRLADIVSAMEARVAILNGGDHQVECAERTLARLEQLAAETATRFEQIEKAKGGLESKLSDFEKEVVALSASARSHVEQVAAQQKELETRARAIGLGKPKPSGPLLHRGAMLGLGVIVVGLVIELGVELNRVRPSTLRIEPAVVVKKLEPTPRTSAVALVDATPRLEASATLGVAPVAPPVALIPLPISSVASSAASSSRSRMFTSPGRGAPFTGTLAVQSEPSDAAVFVDHLPVGRTPLKLPRWRAGSHAVWIEREGYQRWTAAVLVPADKVTRVSASLQPDSAQ